MWRHTYVADHVTTCMELVYAMRSVFSGISLQASYEWRHLCVCVHSIICYNSIYFSKLIWLQKKFTQIFIYFSKPLRLLYGLIIYEIGNFSFFALYSLLLLSFFLYLKSVPIYVIVHANIQGSSPVLNVRTYIHSSICQGPHTHSQ